MERGDAELLEAARARDSAAWRTLVERHSAKCYAVARSFRLDSATASDVVQTAWLRLLERGDQIRDANAIGPWLAMVVRNEARKIVTRQRAVPVDTPWEQTIDPDVVPPDAALLAGERVRAVRVGLSRLGEECRQLLQLLTADPPPSYEEIGAALGRPVGSIGPTRQRCLEQLRKALPAGFGARDA
jgi:RNA polymerase sigma factor (sigma-70 family)